MRVFGFWVLFAVVGTTLMCLAFSNSSVYGMTLPRDGESVLPMATNRKLKGEFYNLSSRKKKRDLSNVKLDDYPRIDPAPSSKAAIKSGPIEHGTPLMPYIPQPTPPNHPRHGGPP